MLTVDSVQLTVVASLRDNFRIFSFISMGNSLTVNCQLSTVNLHPSPICSQVYFAVFIEYVSTVSRAHFTLPSGSTRYTAGRSRLRNRAMPSVTQ